jgi:hypothetical protein
MSFPTFKVKRYLCNSYLTSCCSSMTGCAKLDVVKFACGVVGLITPPPPRLLHPPRDFSIADMKFSLAAIIDAQLGPEDVVTLHRAIHPRRVPTGSAFRVRDPGRESGPPCPKNEAEVQSSISLYIWDACFTILPNSQSRGIYMSKWHNS